jgi:hypothetical protein
MDAEPPLNPTGSNLQQKFAENKTGYAITGAYPVLFIGFAPFLIPYQKA